MAEQQLDLLEFPAPGAAELGAGSAEVVRPQPETQLVPVKDRGGEDRLGRERVAGDLAVAVERAQDPPLGNAGRGAPPVDRLLDPGRDRDRAQAAVLAAEVHDHPAAVALLDVLDRQCHGFGAAQPAADQQGEEGAVPLSL